MERLRRALRGADRGEKPALPVGEAMHPVALVAVLLLVVNDWVLKAQFPGVATGKISDVAGLIFAPVVLTAAFGLVSKLLRVRDPYLTHRRLVLAIAATGVTFAAVKLSPDAAEALANALGHLGRRASIALDRTDLLTLPSLLIAYWIGRDELKWLSR
jgi:K+ transporter